MNRHAPRRLPQAARARAGATHGIRNREPQPTRQRSGNGPVLESGAINQHLLVFCFYSMGGNSPNLHRTCLLLVLVPRALRAHDVTRTPHWTVTLGNRQEASLTHQSNHQSTSIARSALCAVPHTQPPRDTTHAEYVQALGFPPRRAVAPMARHASRKWSGAGTIMPFDSARRSTGAGEHPVQQRAARRRASPLQAARGSPQGRGCAADHSTARRAR